MSITSQQKTRLQAYMLEPRGNTQLDLPFGDSSGTNVVLNNSPIIEHNRGGNPTLHDISALTMEELNTLARNIEPSEQFMLPALTWITIHKQAFAEKYPDLVLQTNRTFKGSTEKQHGRIDHKDDAPDWYGGRWYALRGGFIRFTIY